MFRTAQVGPGAGDDYPRRAPVVPRCRLLPSEACLPIEKHIRSLLARKLTGAVRLVGSAGSGKSMALAHLAASLEPDLPVAIVDEPDGSFDAALLQTRLVVLATQTPTMQGSPLTLEMSPWTDDDLIEYLLATHPGRCRAVMEKIKAGRNVAIGGLPELWRIVLDEMAADDRVTDLESAFTRFLSRELSDPQARLAAERLSLWLLAPWGDKAPLDRCEHRVGRISRHQPVKVMLAARGLVRGLCEGGGADELRGALPIELIDHASRLLASAPEAVQALESLVGGKDDAVHSMAASLLHATGAGWQPARRSIPRLSGAFLTAAQWPRVQLPGVEMDRARMERANLSGAQLAKANLSRAKLVSASLRHTELHGARLTHADLRGADLTGAFAREADFTGAVLASALLDRATLRLVLFRNARLERAQFTRADLMEADFTDAMVADACFAGADLTGAVLQRLSLKQADLNSAVLKMANLAHCDLEELEASNVDFGAACLTNALLTGSVLRRCSFRNATLRGCGLAEIDWEGADLRDADLRGSTFHMGSTRSGLVNSDIPCEGSRTGFYTDDYFDRDYKDPREIRKANLCHADLRGARIDGVDFYLVDLRGASYTNTQAEWFIRCGAVLCSG